MKRMFTTCQPAGILNLNAEERERAGIAPDIEVRWCNAHICLYGTRPCWNARVVVDDQHPMYGTGATTVYPQDRYPLVVMGGSKSGKTLVVAPVSTADLDTMVGKHNGFPVHDYTFSPEELLARAIPERAFTIRQRKNGTWSDYVSVGRARYYRDFAD